jgi:hypothetical protein
VTQGQQATSAHFLFSTEEGTSKNPEEKPIGDGHPPTVEHGGEVHVRTLKESQRVKSTHILSGAERGTSEDTESE